MTKRRKLSAGVSSSEEKTRGTEPVGVQSAKITGRHMIYAALITGTLTLGASVLWWSGRTPENHLRSNGKASHTQPNKITPAPLPPTSPITLDGFFAELSKHEGDDLGAARNRMELLSSLEGRRVEWTGIVKSVGYFGDKDKLCIRLAPRTLQESDQSFGETMLCVFDQSWESDMASLKPRFKITVAGTFWFSGSEVSAHLTNCELKRTEAPSTAPARSP